MRPWPNSSYLHVGIAGIARSIVQESDIRLPWLQEAIRLHVGRWTRGEVMQGFSRQTNHIIWGLKADLDNEAGGSGAGEQTEKEHYRQTYRSGAFMMAVSE